MINPQFNRATLAATLQEAGIAYRWYPVLGGLGDTSTDRPEFIGAMDGFIQLAAHRHVCLLCSESNPSNCHRTSKLGAWLARERAISLSHITRMGAVLTQADAELDLPRDRTPHPLQGEFGW